MTDSRSGKGPELEAKYSRLPGALARSTPPPCMALPCCSKGAWGAAFPSSSPAFPELETSPYLCFQFLLTHLLVRLEPEPCLQAEGGGEGQNATGRARFRAVQPGTVKSHQS